MEKAASSEGGAGNMMGAGMGFGMGSQMGNMMSNTMGNATTSGAGAQVKCPHCGTDNKAGAKSLRSKRPIKIIYTEKYNNQKEAAKRERTIKNWRRKYKLKLIEKRVNLKKECTVKS